MRSTIFFALVFSLLASCGSKDGGSSDVEQAPTVISGPPLSYDIALKGGQSFQTPSITTENALKVKFRVLADQGDEVHSASELKVTIAVNGTEVTPQFSENRYTYGLVGETSNVIDLSSYVTPGVPFEIAVLQPKSDYYCTFWGGYYWDDGVQLMANPLYNVYPGCRKDVKPEHSWSGELIVQTSSTESI